MNPSLEIRKLPITHKCELENRLESNESWKRLMAIIPETLTSNFTCDISASNPAKYCSEDFHTVEEASMRCNRACAKILLTEWGTSGKVRPKLGHLKHLLVKAQLFTAADYLTVDVLKQPAPPRPSRGPAAAVHFSDEIEEIQQIEKMLDEIDYPSSAIADIVRMNSIDTNINVTISGAPSIPKIVVSTPPEVEEKPSFTVPLVVQTEKKSESDLIKFSENNVPNLSFLNGESDYTSTESESIVGSSNSDNIPAVLESFTSDNSPRLSLLLNSSTDPQNSYNIPNLSGLHLSDSSNIPNLSELLVASSKNSRSCPSPLPNLSLNTPLPHFPYFELESVTNNFDETPVSQGGRFLGAGAFGRVYLGDNLLSSPVAVKKVILENAEAVQVDDTVTKQFKNEVEILSKYKHENLVALLGYSCDGLTYCLVYEYVPGGVLKDRLQRHELIWTERLYVALGVARALAYLHTAYSTPLIHRDVKSANILLDYTRKPKLCDFGLIKRALNQNTSTATTIFGTNAYMAPEAFRGDVSVKLDSFSFGVVLLELLTSMPPMDENREGVDLVTHVDDVCAEDIAPLLDKQAGPWSADDINFGHELYQIAKNCLREKKHRPTMSTVCSALGEMHRTLKDRNESSIHWSGP